MAGTIAGITSTWAGYPLDLIKFRMQVCPELGIAKCVSQIRAEGGIRAFFRGVWSPAIGNIPINALMFSANGVCNKFLEANRESIKISEKAKIYLSGSFAGFVSLIAFVPSELIKIRIQDNHYMKSHKKGESLYKEIVREIYYRDGLVGFYRGFWP